MVTRLDKELGDLSTSKDLDHEAGKYSFFHPRCVTTLAILTTPGRSTSSFSSTRQAFFSIFF